MPMTVDIDALLVLQEIDIRIAEKSSRRAALPERRAAVAREITVLEHEKDDLEETVERARLDRRARESELETQQKQQTRYESQLNEVKTNVAYSALLTEIQGAKRTVGALESEILELMEVREASETRIGEIDAELVEKRAAAADELAEIDAEIKALEKEIEVDEVRRKEAASKVDDDLYRVYDRLRRAQKFPALVPVRGSACGSCHGHLPPQVVREVTHHETIHVCEACGVIVYGSEEV